METDIVFENENKTIDVKLFDDSWIHDYEVSELEYSSFYKEKTENIKLNYIYVDEKNHISCLNQESIFIENSKLDKEKLIDIIKINRKKNNIHYKLISILKCNITLDPDHIKTYIEDDDFNEDFLSNVDILQDIYFGDTINLFQDLNGLYFIFCDKKKNHIHKNSITKKIVIRLSQKNKNTRKSNK